MDSRSEPLAETLAEPASASPERRDQSDRRQTPTTIWGPFRRREAASACAQRRTPAAVFCRPFLAGVLAVVLMLLIATITDGLLTVQLITAGGNEINPLMDRLLGFGLLPFFLGKYVLTVVGLPLLLLWKNFYLFGTRIRVGYLLPLTVVLYAVLIGYQLVLTSRWRQ